MKIGRLFAFATLAAAALSPGPAEADVANCQNLYVGPIRIEQGQGLRAVVFLDNPTDASGSLWVYFDNWSADEKKSALATLTAAKISGHRVHVTTHFPGGCSLLTDGGQAKSLYLATSP